MAYKKEIKDKALQILADRKFKADREARQRRDEIIAKFPDYLRLENTRKKTMTQMFKLIAMSSDNFSEKLNEIKSDNQLANSLMTSLLTDNGYPKDYLKEKYFCDKCNDSGYIDGYMCSCMKLLLQELSYDELNKVIDIKQFGFDNFLLDYYSDTFMEQNGITTREAMRCIYDFCINYANTFTKNSCSIFMSGTAGLGKTHLSIAIAKKVIEKSYNVIYGPTQYFVSEIEKEKFNPEINNNYCEQNLETCDLLILDDLGTEFTTQYTISVIYNIINSRDLNCLPTIINTNMDMRDLQQKYSARIVSRIMGSYKNLAFKGNDIRLTKRVRN